jgi:large subunit ribosomal protein L3
MKFLLARKERMTQIFTDDGRMTAGTVLSATPMTVTQVKSKEARDGYAALQVGFGARRPKNVSKAVLGHGKGKAFSVLKEFRTDEAQEVGAELSVDRFAVGDEVQVAGHSKGRGFAGVVKRYNFKGGRRSHGQKHSERERGSSGGGPGRAGGRVVPGMRMAGRMGGTRTTVKNLKVIAVDAAANQIIISGAVPGARGSLVEIIAA